MKKLFTLIGLLTTISLYSQNDSLSKPQQKNLLEIATPSKLQEWADARLFSKKADSIINAKEDYIDFLLNKIEQLKDEHTKTLVEIAKNNQNINNTTNEIDHISDDQLKFEKNKWKGLHFYIGIKENLINFGEPTFSGYLRYETKKIEYVISAYSNKNYTIGINFIIF